MKTYIKIFIPYLISLVCAVLLFRQCERASRAEVALTNTTEEARIWEDKYGRSNAEISVIQMEKQSFRKYHVKVVDSLKKAGVKIKTVEKIVTINTSTTGSVVLKNNFFSDQWSKFSLKDSTLFFNITDSIPLSTYHRKFGFLNLKSKYTTRATTFNPNTVLTGITSSEITPKSPRVSLGVNVGYGLNLSGGVVRPGFHAGVGFQVRIF